MKTTLLVVGRTVEPYFVTAINEYVQRTRRYLSFDMEVIPELKNTKSISEEVQKEKEGELILKALQPGDVVFFWTSNEGQAEYAGIYVGDGKFVAARNEENPVSELDFNSNYFQKRYVTARRFEK